jgi:Fic family protein
MITKRQQTILDYIRNNNGAAISGILLHLSQNGYSDLSKITALRDIDKLIASGRVKKAGRARATRYEYVLSVDEYFEIEPDDRVLVSDYFNFEVWDKVKSIFSPKETEVLNKVNEKYISNRRTLSPTMLKKEYERLTIELSWKSSKIEGNTYTLLDTERLIKENKEAEGRKREEAIMILNHKSALDFIFENPDYFKEISAGKIEEMHRLLTEGLGVGCGIRKRVVGIVGTKFRPLDNLFQIREALERLADLINNTVEAINKAVIAILMIAYIQPFEDGNKRTSRMLANAILYAHDFCPLSYRSVDEAEYKKATLLFYEQNDYSYFKQLFAEQFTQAVNIYF